MLTYFYFKAGDLEFFQPTNTFTRTIQYYARAGSRNMQVSAIGEPDWGPNVVYFNGSEDRRSYRILKVSKFKDHLIAIKEYNEVNNV